MKKPFDKIKLSQLFILYNTLADTQVRNIDNIKRKYLESALFFDETLCLLEDLKIVKNKSGELFLSKEFSSFHKSIEDFKKKIIPLLLSASGDIANDLRTFLLNFQINKDRILYNASELEKIKYSDTRNILLELGFITTSENNRTYFINSDYTDLYYKQISHRILTPEALKKKQAENDSIGLAAEKAVIEFEIKRLTNISLQRNEIEHTSQANVLAGYDIKSFEDNLDSNSKRIYRYIEVKAVSIEDYKYYWSINEIKIAKVLAEEYYLYLLPVVSNDTFDFEKMMIVNNPYKNVYLNRLDWNKEEESISFSKNLDK